MPYVWSDRPMDAKDCPKECMDRFYPSSSKYSRFKAASRMQQVANDVRNGYGSDHELTEMAHKLYLKLCVAQDEDIVCGP